MQSSQIVIVTKKKENNVEPEIKSDTAFLLNKLNYRHTSLCNDLKKQSHHIRSPKQDNHSRVDNYRSNKPESSWQCLSAIVPWQQLAGPFAGF